MIFICPRLNRAYKRLVNDLCDHKRSCLSDLIGDVRRHLRWDGPWRYRLSELYYAPGVEAAVAELRAAELKAA